MEPATKTPNIHELLNEIQRCPEVLRASVWRRPDVARVYVTIRRSAVRHAGDSAYKVYLDAATGWHLEPGRGPRSDAFKTNLKIFVKRFCPDLIHLT